MTTVRLLGAAQAPGTIGIYKRLTKIISFFFLSHEMNDWLTSELCFSKLWHFYILEADE